ncbi:MAG TPA: SLC13 family permease [Dehalococcoidia bacterium]|nr:SLC13 family permease [Dehalococcoidia bacterium]
MPDTSIIMALAVLAVAMGLFIFAKLRVDLIALCILLVLVILGLISPNQVLFGFANQATAIVAAMFILSAGLVRTGLVDWLARQIDKLAGKAESQLIFVLCISIAALSAFVVNTATVAIFIPVAVMLARSRKISSSRVLMPLSFASQFGGVCTLIGTSTNILVNSIAVTSGMDAFGLFEFAPLGLAMATVGIIYLMFVTRWMLPKHKGEFQQIDRYRLADYLAEVRVAKNSSLIGKSWEGSKASSESDVNLTNLIRDDKATSRPSRTKIRGGDILLIHGNCDRLIELEHKYGLESQANVVMNDNKISSHGLQLVEALIPPRSILISSTLETANFYRRYRSIVLALQRRGKTIRDRLRDIKLEGGDTLLLQVDKNNLSRLMKSSDLIVTNELTELYLRRDRAITAFLILGVVVTLAALNVVPILIAALIGAIGMVLGRCLTIEEAYRAIDWRVIFLLGGIIPLGLALEQSGTALWLSNTILTPFMGLDPVVVLALVYLMTAVLTEVMSNNAAAIILAPIVISVAAVMNVNPRPFLVAITFAASTSFATPVGYQTNTMVYAPGGYRFTDFTRIGGPLNLIFLGLAVLLIPRLWAF